MNDGQYLDSVRRGTIDNHVAMHVKRATVGAELGPCRGEQGLSGVDVRLLGDLANNTGGRRRALLLAADIQKDVFRS